MTKKYTVSAIILVVFTLSILVCHWFEVQSSGRLVTPLLAEAMQIRNVGLDLSLARATFNVTAIGTNMAPEITVKYVRTNGTLVDAYPQNPSLKPGESVLINVYYHYDYNATYEVEFCTQEGHDFPFTLRT